MTEDDKLNKLMQNPQVKALMKQIIGKINHNKQKYNRRLSDDAEMLQKLKAELNSVLADLQAKNENVEQNEKWNLVIALTFISIL